MNRAMKFAAALVAVGICTGVAQAGDPNKIVVDGSTTVGPIALERNRRGADGPANQSRRLTARNQQCAEGFTLQRLAHAGLIHHTPRHRHNPIPFAALRPQRRFLRRRHLVLGPDAEQHRAPVQLARQCTGQPC